MEGLGRSSEDEQRRLEAALIQSTELLRGYKEQWTQQLNAHSTSMNEMVQTSVRQALSKRKEEQEAEMRKTRDEQKKMDA